MAFDKIFYCSHCGARLPGSAETCASCGFDSTAKEPYVDEPLLGAGGIGWSDVVLDPRFAGYQRNRRIFVILFTILLVAAITGFLFASGDLRADQEGLLVAAVISIMFTSIAAYAVRATKRRGKDWTGTILEKQGDPDAKYDRQPLILIIGLETGEVIRREVADPASFDSFAVGDRLRNHQQADLKFLEKFDKSRDLVLVCPSCAMENDARANFCRACGSPLLKGAIPAAGATHRDS